MKILLLYPLFLLEKKACLSLKTFCKTADNIYEI